MCEIPTIPPHLYKPVLRNFGIPENIKNFDIYEDLKVSDKEGATYEDPDQLPWDDYERFVTAGDVAPTILRSYGHAHEKGFLSDLHGFFVSNRTRCFWRWASIYELFLLQGFTPNIARIISRFSIKHSMQRQSRQAAGNAIPPPFAVIALSAAMLVLGHAADPIDDVTCYMQNIRLASQLETAKNLSGSWSYSERFGGGNERSASVGRDPWSDYIDPWGGKRADKDNGWVDFSKERTKRSWSAGAKRVKEENPITQVDDKKTDRKWKYKKQGRNKNTKKERAPLPSLKDYTPLDPFCFCGHSSTACNFMHSDKITVGFVGMSCVVRSELEKKASGAAAGDNSFAFFVGGFNEDFLNKLELPPHTYASGMHFLQTMKVTQTLLSRDICCNSAR